MSVFVRVPVEMFRYCTYGRFTAGEKTSVIPRFAAYPLGSGNARFSVMSPSTWPTGREPVIALPTGDVARLTSGKYLEVQSAHDGRLERIAIPSLAELLSAKPGAAAMALRPDGTLFIGNPAIGRAITLDPVKSYETTSVVDFPRPAAPFGGPSTNIVLSRDGRTLYVLGGAKAGGLASYDANTGGISASYSHGEHYIGIYQLSSGTVLAISGNNPRLTFFSPALEPVAAASTELNVTAVF
jgi:hypothetical protein